MAVICLAVTPDAEPFDYCASCGRFLCPEHMAAGCCGHVPARGRDHDACDTGPEDDELYDARDWGNL